MASSENLASLEPWNMMLKPTFPDLWFSEAYARDTETLTKALQKTLFSNIDETSRDTNTNDNSTNSFSMNETFSSDSFNPFTSLIETAPPNSDGLERFWVRPRNGWSHQTPEKLGAGCYWEGFETEDTSFQTVSDNVYSSGSG
ncbi:hypothetical protein OIU76_028840 [Salix suchowensis]|nr:hypothetical protein OIU76_028840 [Salix suchowensis]